jgi:hypothetical protein
MLSPRQLCYDFLRFHSFSAAPLSAALIYCTPRRAVTPAAFAGSFQASIAIIRHYRLDITPLIS